VPVLAIALQGAAAAVIALSGRYEQILNYVVSVDFIAMGLTGAALFVYRRRGERGAFAAPGHPWINGDSTYGYAPLQERLARKAGVDPDRVVHATGASMANFLVLAAAASPGDDVLVEEPTYSLLVDAARWLRLDVRRFPRRAEEAFRLDPREVEKALTPRTRLVVLTNLHHPSSAFTPPEDLRAVGEAARSVGARVLVDEVYLESLAVLGRPAGSAARLGPEFVATSSLTKAYGLSGLRCGWVVAEPALARRMWRLNDLFGVIPAHPAERLSVVALDRLDRLDRVAARARTILEANAEGANAFLAARPELACPPVDGGMIDRRARPLLRGGGALPPRPRVCPRDPRRRPGAARPGARRARLRRREGRAAGAGIN
jgi:DNA-binding transcriptional MocR family regulator